jgi:hypothetical protein
MDLTSRIQSILGLTDQDRVDEAFESLAAALTNRPDNPQLLALLGRLALMAGILEGHKADAVRTFRLSEAITHYANS